MHLDRSWTRKIVKSMLFSWKQLTLLQKPFISELKTCNHSSLVHPHGQLQLTEREPSDCHERQIVEVLQGEISSSQLVVADLQHQLQALKVCHDKIEQEHALCHGIRQQMEELQNSG